MNPESRGKVHAEEPPCSSPPPCSPSCCRRRRPRPPTTRAPVPVDRFEGEVPFASQPAEGIFTWGGDSDDPPALQLTARADAPEGQKVLTGTYDISGYGGFTHDFAADRPAHDWSARRGVRFWWEGQNSGKKVPFEIKDGGANGEASELWTTSFTDDFSGWKQIELPFTDFAYRTDYQPVGGIDHVLGLTQMWGYAAHPPRRRQGPLRHGRRRAVRQGRPGAAGAA